MNVNVKISLTESERLLMGQLVYGKAKPIMRKDVNKFVEGAIAFVTESGSNNDEPITSRPMKSDMSFLSKTHGDPHLEGKDASYIVGWNKVKFSTKGKSHARSH